MFLFPEGSFLKYVLMERQVELWENHWKNGYFKWVYTGCQ